LRCAVLRFETYGEASSQELEEDTGLSYWNLRDVLSRLREEGFLDAYFGGEGFHVTAVYERGLRTVGAWPSAESLVERLVAALEAQAQAASTPEERSRVRKTLEALRGVGLDVLTNAAGSALGGAVA
jgi:DNA-binding GntR family transcriptional regulator